LQPRQDRAFSLQRTYARLDDEDRLLDPTGARVGDRILVTLRLTVRQPAHYLAIDDPLPSVLEALNPEFKTQATSAAALAALGGLGTPWQGDFHELRSDRVLFFGNHVAPGDYRIRYLARVRAGGQVTAPPAKAEEMYHPERFSLSEAQRLSTGSFE
jgi:alpha-2-macroglobulin